MNIELVLIASLLSHALAVNSTSIQRYNAQWYNTGGKKRRFLSGELRRIIMEPITIFDLWGLN